MTSAYRSGPIPRMTSRPEPETDRGARSVLVVDDDDTKRYVLASWLRRAGFRVVEAATGADALRMAAAAAAGDLDVVVLDVHLPDMSGLDVSRSLRADRRTDALSILHVSAVAVDTEERSAGLNQGADAYLVDPIEPQEFLATVRALQRQSRARQDAERTAARLRQLGEATIRVTVAVSRARLAAAVAEGAATLAGGAALALLLSDPDGAVSARVSRPGRIAETATVDRAAAQRLLTAGADATADMTGPEWDAVLASRRPTAPGDSSPGMTNPLAVGRRPGDTDAIAGFSLPLIADVVADAVPDMLTGAGWVAYPMQRREGGLVGLVAVQHQPDGEPDDHALVRQIVDAAAVTQENLRLFAEEHRIALTLQRSLLPATLPALPGLRLAARYQASNQQAEIGGDFFDAFETPDGSALVVIGDVQGHSLAAAVVMGELRYSLRAYAEDGYPPAEVLRRLNRLLLRHHPDLTATVCIVRLGPDRGTATVANAGHLPPLVVDGGGARYLDYGGPLLGVPGTRPPEPYTIEVPPGSRLLLMTDGLVERRDRSLDIDLNELAAEVAADHRSVEVVADTLMARERPGGDDAALVLIERSPE
jgi:DNA-binding response OmpR family regulator